MTEDFFPHSLTKQSYTTLSCRHFSNVRVKYHKMNTIIQSEILGKILMSHSIQRGIGAVTSPGIVVLPTPFNLSTFTYPCLKQFQNCQQYQIHLTCNHRCTDPIEIL